jgi:hypothetical protein
MAKTLAELREMHTKIMSEEKSTGGGQGTSSWATFQDGDNFVRFLPGREDPLDFFVEGAVHKYQNDEGQWRNYKCRKPQGEKCPVCDFYFDLWRRHKDLNLGKDSMGKNIRSKFGDLATKIKAKDRFYAIGVVRALEEAEQDPVKYIAMSKQLFDRVMSAMISEDFQDENDPDSSTIIDLERGNDFNIRITQQGQWKSFNESQAKYKKTRAGNPAQVAEWMENELNLQSLVEAGSYEDGKELVMSLEASLNPIKTETTSDTPPWDGEKDLQV